MQFFFNKIYIFGGDAYGNVNDVVEVINPRTLTLTLLPESTMPMPMTWVKTVQLGDKMLIIGGIADYGSGGVFRDPASVLEFDPETGKWRDTGVIQPAPAKTTFAMIYNN